MKPIVAMVVVALSLASADPSAASGPPPCTASGPAIAGCLGAKVIVDELNKGSKAFGPNGEGMKILRGIFGMFGGGGAGRGDLPSELRHPNLSM